MKLRSGLHRGPAQRRHECLTQRPESTNPTSSVRLGQRGRSGLPLISGPVPALVPLPPPTALPSVARFLCQRSDPLFPLRGRLCGTACSLARPPRMLSADTCHTQTSPLPHSFQRLLMPPSGLRAWPRSCPPWPQMVLSQIVLSHHVKDVKTQVSPSPPTSRGVSKVPPTGIPPALTAPAASASMQTVTWSERAPRFCPCCRHRHVPALSLLPRPSRPASPKRGAAPAMLLGDPGSSPPDPEAETSAQSGAF